MVGADHAMRPIWNEAGGDLGICGPKRYERKEPKYRSGGSRDGELGPSTLRFDSEVQAALLERHFDGPTANEPSDNSDVRRIEICAQKWLRIADVGGIAHEHPVDRRRRQGGMIPDRRSGRDLAAASFIATPIWHRQSDSTCLLIFELFGDFGQRATFLRRSAFLSGLAFRGGFEQIGVEAEPRDETDMAGNRVNHALDKTEYRQLTSTPSPLLGDESSC